MTNRFKAALLSSLAALVVGCATHTTHTAGVESFDQDPTWEGVNNRVTPAKLPTVTQDFGYSPAEHAAGGKIWRSVTPAWYAVPIGRLSLDQEVFARGTLRVPASSAGSGFVLGFFNPDSVEGGRPRSSLALHADGEHNVVRLFCRTITRSNQGGAGTKLPPGPTKAASILPDGKPHRFEFHYRPEGSDAGTLRVSLDDLPPVDVPVPASVRHDGADLTHFGLVNGNRPGGAMTVWIGDLEFSTSLGAPVKESFTQDPNWSSCGNRVTFTDTVVGGAQNYGYSPTHFAGGRDGEIGGIFWRAEKPWSYYASPTRPLDLTRKLSATGKLSFLVGAPDSGVFLGWFNPDTTGQSDVIHDFLGVRIEGPTRVGHYFQPTFAPTTGPVAKITPAPVVVPRTQPYTFRFDYDPATHQLRVQLGDESATLTVDPSRAAAFTRFGLFTPRVGGSYVKMYLDDLDFTR